MKVILTATVDGLGGPGTVKDVADGYARNFLLPRGLAMPATKDAIKRIEEQQAAESRRTAKAEIQSQSLADKLAVTTINLIAKVGSEGRLYGSITSADIAEKLKEQTGEEIDKRKIQMEEPIRHIGTFKVPVHLVGRLTPQVTVVVEGEEKPVEEKPAAEKPVAENVVEEKTAEEPVSAPVEEESE